jgi:hypothetical protein
MKLSPAGFAAISGLILLSVYWMIFIGPFFPNWQGNLGHDYEGVFTEIAVGAAHFHRNGLLDIPWFTPAACGGDMFVAGVANPYFNVPQWLGLSLDLVLVAKITFALFAFIGYAGAFWLLKGAFRLDRWGALVGSSIMMFNGFFAYRMVIGHTGFHSFMLIPLIAGLVLTGRGLSPSRLLMASMLLAYVTLSSGLYTLLIAVLSVSTISLIYNLREQQNWWRPHIGLAAALLIAILMSAFKVAISYATSQQFARDGYLQPGVDSILDAIVLPVRLLFFSTPGWESEIRYMFTNYEWNLRRHELDIGVTWVALLLMITGVVKFRSVLFSKPGRVKAFALSGLLVTLLIPLALNFYHPQWSEVLKQMPLLKSFSVFTRLYAVYIPMVVVLAALAFSAATRWRAPLAISTVAMVVLTHALADKSYYEGQYYNPAMMQDFHNEFLEDPSKLTDIHTIDAASAVNYNGQQLRVRNELFVLGVSNKHCKNDMFGYRLEYFPQPELLREEFPARHIENGRFNMKNPACYVFPEENNCRPGDHFRQDQAESLAAFLAYRQFEFSISTLQKVANGISLLSIILVVGALSVLGIIGLAQRLSPRPQDH